MTVNVIQQLTNSLLVALRRPVAEGGTGKQVGDHDAPKNPQFPYHVLYQVPGGSFWGAPLVDPEGGATVRFLVRSVGSRRDQAQAAADVARRVVIGRDTDGAFLSSIDPPVGYLICGRLPSSDEPPGVDPEGAPPNRVFSVPEQFDLIITPQ